MNNLLTNWIDDAIYDIFFAQIISSCIGCAYCWHGSRFVCGITLSLFRHHEVIGWWISARTSNVHVNCYVLDIWSGFDRHHNLSQKCKSLGRKMFLALLFCFYYYSFYSIVYRVIINSIILYVDHVLDRADLLTFGMNQFWQNNSTKISIQKQCRVPA